MSERYLVDTNVLLHLARRRGVGQQIEGDYALSDASSGALVSVVSVGELMGLALTNGWSKATQDAFVQLLASSFEVVPVQGLKYSRCYAELLVYSRSLGRSIGQNDLWIAATAKLTGATLLTTDTDFDHLSRRHIRRVHIDPLTGKTTK